MNVREPCGYRGVVVRKMGRCRKFNLRLFATVLARALRGLHWH